MHGRLSSVIFDINIHSLQPEGKMRWKGKPTKEAFLGIRIRRDVKKKKATIFPVHIFLYISLLPLCMDVDLGWSRKYSGTFACRRVIPGD